MKTMNVQSASVQLLVLCLAVSVPRSHQQDCPAIDTRCTCVRDFISQSIVCQRLEYVDRVPPFASSTTVYESLTVKDLTMVHQVQARAFRGLRVNRFDLQSLCIEQLDVDAFVGLDTTQLNEIHLGDNYIQSVPAGTLRNLSSLTVLGLQQNAITAVDPALFRDLDSLAYLHLEGNRLSSLPDALFSDLGTLRELYLSDNELTDVTGTVLRGLSNLYKLELNGNALRTVDVGAFTWLSSLRELQLQDNQLGPVIDTPMFDGLSQLETVELSNNFLAGIQPETFARTPRLQNVYVANNQLRTFDRSTFANLPRLATLRLSGNRLRDLPRGWLENSTSVVRLYLQQNRLRSISRETFLGLSSLQSLFLSQNRIRQLNATTFQSLPALSLLDLNENAIEYLAPELFHQNTRLSSLHLRSNRLRAVPEGVFRDLSRLRYLYMAVNLIESLEYGAFTNLRSLSYLELSRNRIETISDGAFVDLPNLFSLLLDRNVISNVSDSVLSRLPNLRTIYLNYNWLTAVVNGTFTNSSKLQRVFLANNQLTLMEPGTFSDLEMLQTLDLSFNNISYLSPDLFATGPARLRLLNVSYNRLEELDEGRFRGLDGLSSLDLSSNLLTSLRNENFLGLRSLRSLLLDNNRLSSVENMTFSGLWLLSELSLASNRLSSLSSIGSGCVRSLTEIVLDRNLVGYLSLGALTACRSLASLSLRHNQIDLIDANVSSDSLLTLRHLDLGYNRLTGAALEDLGSFFPHLESLKLDGNGILALPESMFRSGGSNVVELDLSSNRLRSQNVFSCLMNLTGVSILRLNRNLIDEIVADLSTLLSHSVTVLSLQYNRLTTDGIAPLYNFTRLTELRLDVNRLTGLPPSIFARMFRLRTLTASDNRIQQLDDDSFHGAARTLTSLALAENYIHTVSPMTFAKLTAIRHLDLSDNRIAELTFPPIMSNLNRLSVRMNQLTTFPAGLRSLPLIQTLDLSINRMTGLPLVFIQNYATAMSVNLADNALRDVDSVRFVGIADRLDLSGNQLHQISPTSNILSALLVVNDVDFSRSLLTEVPAVVFDNLDVIRNNLSFYSNAIGNLENWRLNPGTESRVRSLVLRRNIIRELPSNVTESLRASLVHLDLRDNLLETLNQSDFEAMERLELLELMFNHLECDCRLAWLRLLAEQVRVDKATCAAPRSLIGQSVLCYTVHYCDEVSDDIKNVVAARCDSWPSTAAHNVNAVNTVLLASVVVIVLRYFLFT